MSTSTRRTDSFMPGGRRRFILGCGALALGLAGIRLPSEALAGSDAAFSDAGSAGSEASPLPALAPLGVARRTSQAFGTDISMMVLHANKAVGERALDDAFAELTCVEQVMSVYLESSQVSQLNARGVLQSPDPYLVRVLEESCSMSKLSGGAFDITVQPLWDLYAAAQKSGGLPAQEAIARMLRRVDWRGVTVTKNEVRFREKGMAITLNGIAQGFAADRAMEALKRHGIEHALVNAGEISSLGTKASGYPWVVGVQHPRQKDSYLGLVGLDGRCLSTSGDYATIFTADFSRNHIFDPATGGSPEEFSSVTTVTPDATTADALSTAVFVLGLERGLALVEATPGADALFVMKDRRMKATRSFPWRAENGIQPDSQLHS